MVSIGVSAYGAYICSKQMGFIMKSRSVKNCRYRRDSRNKTITFSCQKVTIFEFGMEVEDGPLDGLRMNNRSRNGTPNQVNFFAFRVANPSHKRSLSNIFQKFCLHSFLPVNSRQGMTSHLLKLCAVIALATAWFEPANGQVPGIVSQPTNVVVAKNGTAVFTVGVTNNGPVYYQWQFNGTNLPAIFITVAGTGAYGYSGDGGPATNAVVIAGGVAVDNIGNVIIADNARIRKVDTNGIITTIAGNGTNGYSGDGGPATNAMVSFDNGVAVDSAGNIFVVDEGDRRIRKIGTNGIITTIAGNGTAGFSGDGGQATNAMLDAPLNVTVDAIGNVFFVDGFNQRVRKVGTNGIIKTVAGNGTEGHSGDGGQATNAALGSPWGVAVDNAGNLFFTEAAAQFSSVRKVATNGIIRTVAGTGTSYGYNPNTVATNTPLNSPENVTTDSLGNFYIADSNNKVIRKVGTNGLISTVAGIPGANCSGCYSTGFVATNFPLAGTPHAVALDSVGNMYIADGIVQRVGHLPTFTIKNVDITNIGNYSVIITGTGGSVTSSVASLNMKPFISAQPKNVLLWQGASMALSVTAGGSTPMSYQWTLEGTNISGATNATYFISSASTNDAGSYTVVVTNSFGQVTSQTATVTVGYFIQGQGSQVVTNGAATTFGVGVAGPGTFSYEWLFNGSDIGPLITTVAGNGTAGFSGDGGQARNAQLNAPNGVAVEKAGQILIADTVNQRIRLVAANGVTRTVAGNGSVGYTGDGGSALNAALNYPLLMALGPNTNLIFADGDNRVIRQLTALNNKAPTISTVAGGGTNFGGVATNAAIGFPGGVAVDGIGNIFFSDADACLIWKVDTNGIMTVVAGSGTNGFAGDRGAATNAQLSIPMGIALDTNGNLFIADFDNQRVRKVDTNGIITTVAGNGYSYLYDYQSYGGFSGDGGVATNAELNQPYAVAVDGSGNLFISDAANNRVRKVDTTGIITTFAGNGYVSGIDPFGFPIGGYSGDGNIATNAALNNIWGIAADSAGNLLIADAGNNRIRKVYPLPTNSPALTLSGITSNNIGNYSVVLIGTSGNITSVVATLDMPPAIVAQPSNFLALAGVPVNFSVVVAGSSPLNYQWTFNSNNISGATNANYLIASVSTNDAGTYAVTITNAFGSATSTNATMTVAYIAQQPMSQMVNNGGTAGLNVLLSIPGTYSYQWQLNGTNLPHSGIITTVAGNGTNGYSGDGGAGTNANLGGPEGLAIDASGNLFIADHGNSRVRKLDTNGTITTVAGTGVYDYSGDGGFATNAAVVVWDVAVDSVGNLFIAADSRIRKVDTNGIITTVAGTGTNGYFGDGGSATNAKFNTTYAVVVDPIGNLFIADAFNYRVRKVDTNGIISTVAGNGSHGFFGDGGLATNAQLYWPNGLALDSVGNLFIADLYNNRVRRVGTNGIITTVAGNGGTFSGDGGPAINAGIDQPQKVLVDSHGNLFISHTGIPHVREVLSDNGVIISVAGGGQLPYDGLSATDMNLDWPVGMALDNAGDVFIVEQFGNRVRKVTAVPYPPIFPAYNLSPVSGASAGDYSLVISNASGSITSAVARVTAILSTNTTINLEPSVVSTTNFAITWNTLNSVPPLSYQLQYSTNLDSGAWLNLGTAVNSNNASFNYTEPFTGDLEKFYRVHVEQ